MKRLANVLVTWFWSEVSSAAINLYLFADKRTLSGLNRADAMKKGKHHDTTH